MEQIIDLSCHQMTLEDFNKLPSNRKDNIKSNVIGYIFTDKIKELYNLETNKKNKWIIKYDKLIFIIQLYENDIIKITAPSSNGNKIDKLLKSKEINIAIKQNLI
jgi:hypothetical protein